MLIMDRIRKGIDRVLDAAAKAREGNGQVSREARIALEALKDYRPITIHIPSHISPLQFPRQTVAMCTLLLGMPKGHRILAWQYVCCAAEYPATPVPAAISAYQAHAVVVIALFRCINREQRYEVMKLVRKIIPAILRATSGDAASCVTVTFGGGVTVAPSVMP